MRLGNEPVEQVQIKGAKSSGITHTREFEIWQAAVSAGATLDELEKLYQGRYDTRFLAMVVMRHRLDRKVEKITEAIQVDMMRRKK